MGEESSSDAVTSLVAYEPCENNNLERLLRTYIIRVPSNGTHPPPTSNSQPTSRTTLSSQSPSPATVSQRDNLPLTSQIPDDGVSSAASTSQNVLDLLIP